MRSAVKLSVILTLILCFSLPLFAELPQINTVRVRQVGPGVIHKTLHAPSKPWVINIMEVDIHDPALEIRAIDGGGLQKPSVMASAKEGADYRLVGATNGDFFEGDYSSTNAGIVDGKIIKLEKLTAGNPVYWPALTISDDNTPLISCNLFQGSVSKGNNSHAIHDVNVGRATNKMVFYNHYMGSTTGTGGGTEIKVRPVDGWKVNETMRCVMEAKSTSGNMALNTGYGVLSGHGTASTFLANNYQVGDTIDVLLEMRAFEDLSQAGVSYHYMPSLEPVKHLIGGFPTFVRNGENFAIEGYKNQNGGASFATDRHPRTAIGYNQDTTKMYFVVVDGRQTSSQGINLVDLADIMIQEGAWRAMNFDGGGSTVMVVDNDVVNTPSDGVERSVRNCCAIYSTAPAGSLSKVQIELDTLRLYRNQSKEFMISGWDGNYNPANINDWGTVSFTTSVPMGTITGSQGLRSYSADSEGSSGYIYAELNGVRTDSMYVFPYVIDPIIINPKHAVGDTNKSISFKIEGVNANGDTVTVPNSVFEFSVKDGTVGEIDENGNFLGKKEGATMVYVNYGSQVDSASVMVIVGEGESNIDSMETIGSWNLSGEKLDMDFTQLTLESRPDMNDGGKCFRIDYKTTGSGKIYLNNDIMIHGVPENILLDVKGDGERHRLYVNLEDANGEEFTVYKSGYIDNADNFETIYMDASGINASYPIKIKNIYIKLRTGIQEGTIYVDALRLTYPNYTSIEYKDIDPIDDFKLYPAYPNPFNPSTTIPFEIGSTMDVKLDIFNLKGEKLETLFEKTAVPGSYKVNWSPIQYSSGTYIYKLKAGKRQEVGKLVYLK